MTKKYPMKLDHSIHLRVTPFPPADANGNCVAFIDEAGNTQAHYEYNAFGGTVSASGDMDEDFRFRFSSKYLDEETGFYYYGYRYYDHATGRWLNRDPIGVLGGPNTCNFVYNSGINYADYLGLTVVVSDLMDMPVWKKILGDKDKFLYKFPNLKTYDADFEKFKDRINEALDVLRECCKKEGLEDEPICKMFNSGEEYRIRIIPQEQEKQKIDQGFGGGGKRPNDITLELPWNGPDAELLNEVYQMNGGVASVYNQTVPSLIVHETFHILNPDVYDEKELGNLDAENRMRKCCPELGENFTRDSYAKPNLRIKGVPPLDYRPNVNLNWIYNFDNGEN